MKQRVYRGSWAGCSDYQERINSIAEERAKFEKSELKKYLDEDWKIRKATLKPKRPRIKREEPFKVILVFGKPMKITIEEYNKHCL